jgi:hypothetical protein
LFRTPSSTSNLCSSLAQYIGEERHESTFRY